MFKVFYQITQINTLYMSIFLNNNNLEPNNAFIRNITIYK